MEANTPVCFFCGAQRKKNSILKPSTAESLCINDIAVILDNPQIYFYEQFSRFFGKKGFQCKLLAAYSVTLNSTLFIKHFTQNTDHPQCFTSNTKRKLNTAESYTHLKERKSLR